MSFWDDLSNIATQIFQPIEKAVVQPISHALAGVDKFVNHSIPGGWATIGAATLMAVGIANPTLLSLADEGALSGEALDAFASTDQIAQLTETINTLQPLIDEGAITGSDIGSLLSSNWVPSDIVSLTDAGWSGTDLTAIADHGFTPEYLNTLSDAGFTPDQLLKIADSATNTPFSVSDLTDLINNGATPQEVTDLTSSGFSPTKLSELVDAGYSPSDLATAIDNGASVDQIEYLKANGWTSDLNNYLAENGISTPAESGPGAITQNLPTGTPTGPIEPTSAPWTPSEPPPQLESPFSQISSTGISDSSPGTIYTNADGVQEIVLDNGRTVNLADYQSALESGKPISVDGMLQTSTTPVGTVSVEPGPVSIDVTGLPGTLENPPPVGTVLPDGTQLASIAQQTEAINGVSNGAIFDEASNSWVIPKDIAQAATQTGLTTGQVVALGGAAAAVATVAASGGAGASTAFTGTPAPGTTTPAGGTPGPGGTPGGTPGPVAPATPEPPLTGPSPTPPPAEPGPAPIHDYSEPYTMPDGSPVDTSTWTATDIAKALAAGWIVNTLLNPGVKPPPDYKQQFFPIPTYNASGLVNPGVNPGFIEPSAVYGQQPPGVDQYYWGQHGYAQNMSDLANLNANAPNMPAQPYGNPNAVHLGQVITPEQLGYPNEQGMAAAAGTANPTQGNFTGLANMNYDIYHNPVEMNTAPPPVAGYGATFNKPTFGQMSTGQGQGVKVGQGLNYTWTPQQLATTNNSGMAPAQQLTSISPAELSAQLLAAANSVPH